MGEDKFPKVGDPMPDVAMETPDGGVVRPSDFNGKRAVFFFYPKDNTPGCTQEAKDFSQLLPKFDAAGVAVVGISKDSPQKHRNFIDKHDLTVPLATDPAENGLSDALGIWTEKSMYGKTFMGMVRSTYLVDADGKIAQIWPKVRANGHAGAVLETVNG